MIKVTSCRFEQCLDMFTKLLVEGSSKTELFRRLFNHVFEVIIFANAKPMRVIISFKTFNILERFQKYTKKSRKISLFLR